MDECKALLTGCLEAWGADVFATVDEVEAATHLHGDVYDVPPVTAVLSLSLPQWQGLRGPIPSTLRNWGVNHT